MARVLTSDVERTGLPVGSPARRWAEFGPGGLAAVSVAVPCTLAGQAVPSVGGPVLAIAAGMALSTLFPSSVRFRPGLAVASKWVLQGSIVLLGLNLSLSRAVAIGVGSMPVLVTTLLVALAMAWVVGRALRLPPHVTTLVGLGTAICGASAIAAANSVIDADDSDVGYSVATIFTFNVVAVLAFPPLGHLLGLSQHAFGLWAGTAVNDTSSVVATASVYGPAAASYSVVVKLTRTLAIIPVCAGLAVMQGRRAGSEGGGGAVRWSQVVPVFVLGFLAAVTVNTLGAVPTDWHPRLSGGATWMVTVALAAVGLSSPPRLLRRSGFRPLLLGAILWLTVGATSLLCQAV